MEAVKSQGADLLRGRDVEDCEGGIDLQNEMLQLEEKWAKVGTDGLLAEWCGGKYF